VQSKQKDLEVHHLIVIDEKTEINCSLYYDKMKDRIFETDCTLYNKLLRF